MQVLKTDHRYVIAVTVDHDGERDTERFSLPTWPQARTLLADYAKAVGAVSVSVTLQHRVSDREWADCETPAFVWPGSGDLFALDEVDFRKF